MRQPGDPVNPPSVVIVGAGMAGLTAARRLREQGVESVILDKGRAPGGRMATRTVGEARFDHGAQHFGARSSLFRAEVEAWTEQALVREWFRAGSRVRPGGEPRFVGIAGMRRIPEALAAGLDVRTAVAVDRLVARDGAVAAGVGHGMVAVGAAVILTPPVPQIGHLLAASGIPLPASIGDLLGRIEYDPCLAVMARLDGPGGLPDGHRSFEDGPIAWIADNHHKGVSAVPAVTVHAAPGFSAEHLEDPTERWSGILCDAAAPHLGGRIVEAIPHRWRYARPRTTLDLGAAGFDAGFPVVMAGEVFAGARIEGAHASGIAAASLVLESL
jgi:predicted NAD/FAD-dependent oxidoreductase